MTDVTKKNEKKVLWQKKNCLRWGSNLASLVRERRDIDWEHTSTLHRQAEDDSVSLGFYGRFAGGCWNVFNFCLWTCGVCWNGVESCVWPLDFGNKFWYKKVWSLTCLTNEICCMGIYRYRKVLGWLADVVSSCVGREATFVVFWLSSLKLYLFFVIPS